jgi:hypothetical protein
METAAIPVGQEHKLHIPPLGKKEAKWIILSVAGEIIPISFNRQSATVQALLSAWI